MESRRCSFLRNGRPAKVREVVKQQSEEFGDEFYTRVTPGAPND